MTRKKQGNTYYEEGKYGKAITEYTEAICLDPGEALIYYRRGKAYYERGDYDKAIADYSEAMRLNPNDASAYYNRASAYYEKGEYDKAIADYSKITRLIPDDFIAYYSRASAHEEQGAYSKAIADYSEALRLVLNPDMADNKFLYETIWDVQIDACDIYQARAQVHIKKNDFKRAVSDLGKALKLEPSYEDIREKLRKAEKAWLEETSNVRCEKGRV